MDDEPDTVRELLKLRRQTGEAIRSLLSDPNSYSDGQVSIPERLKSTATSKLTNLERVARTIRDRLNKKRANP